MNIKESEIKMWDAAKSRDAEAFLEVVDENAELEGIFHITSIWKKTSDKWKLIFNMDSRIIRV